MCMPILLKMLDTDDIVDSDCSCIASYNVIWLVFTIIVLLTILTIICTIVRMCENSLSPIPSIALCDLMLESKLTEMQLTR